MADTPTGPYEIVNILHDYGDNRDMTIYKDDDGKAYHIFATDNNQYMAVTQLK